MRPDLAKWDEARCCLPGCSGALRITRSYSTPIWASSTRSDIGYDHHVSSWSVDCAEGHTLLLPIDTGGDAAYFGACVVHDEGEAHDEDCDDMERLRRVVGRWGDPDAKTPTASDEDQ